MQTVFATEPGGSRASEDYAVCGPDWAVVLDGATPREDVDSGCVHDVPWLVRQLAAGIAWNLLIADLPLPGVLAAAIRATCEAHEATCDLANPDSPSSTVAIIRDRGIAVDYLVLGDSPVILRRADGSLLPVVDDRSDHLPGGRPYTAELVRRHRNAPGGFWVASTSIRAAREAISGSTGDVTDAAVLTDGVTRLRDWYGATWDSMFTVLQERGPSALIGAVREAERKTPGPFGKRHDDATAVYVYDIQPIPALSANLTC